MLEVTRERFKNLYSTQKETIDYMERFGSEIERIEASIIKKIALGN